MKPNDRLTVIVLLLAGALAPVALVAFAAEACPGVGADPCPDAWLNRAVVVALAAGGVGMVAAAFAFVAAFVVGRRIAYAGAWWRAARRGALVTAVVAALGALRMADALSPLAAVLLVVVAAIAEWQAIRRWDDL